MTKSASVCVCVLGILWGVFMCQYVFSHQNYVAQSGVLVALSGCLVVVAGGLMVLNMSLGAECKVAYSLLVWVTADWH